MNNLRSHEFFGTFIELWHLIPFRRLWLKRKVIVDFSNYFKLFALEIKCVCFLDFHVFVHLVSEWLLTRFWHRSYRFFSWWWGTRRVARLSWSLGWCWCLNWLWFNNHNVSLLRSSSILIWDLWFSRAFWSFFGKTLLRNFENIFLEIYIFSSLFIICVTVALCESHVFKRV